MEKAIVTNIQKFSVHDGPGIRSIVFFKGCPLKCEWCSNPENIDPKPQLMVHKMKCIHCGLCTRKCEHGAIRPMSVKKDHCVDCGECTEVCPTKARELKGKYYSVDEVRAAIDKDIDFYRNSGGGLTFSGGEPMLKVDFIIELAREYLEKGLTSVVETCGCVPWANYEKAIPYIDMFYYDVKFIDSEKHKEHCGAGNEQILSNLLKLCERGCQVMIRIPIIPGVNDAEEDLKATAEFLTGIKDKILGVHVLPYHNFGIAKYEALDMAYPLPDVAIPKDEYMQKIKALFELYGLEVKIGG